MAKFGKDNAIREILFNHSLDYYQPNPNNLDGKSNFEVDIELLEPKERVDTEIRVLKHHTPELKVVDLGLTVGMENEDMNVLLARLASENQK